MAKMTTMEAYIYNISSEIVGQEVRSVGGGSASDIFPVGDLSEVPFSSRKISPQLDQTTREEGGIKSETKHREGRVNDSERKKE